MTIRPVVILFLVGALISCTDSKKYPIESVIVDAGYYLSALSEVNQQLSQDAGNVFLRKRKLLISRELRWPEDISEDVDFLKKEEGLSYELVQYAVDFYQVYRYYEKLLNILEEWETLNGQLKGSKRWRITAYLGLGRFTEAKYLLWEYVQENSQNAEALLFAADKYLIFNDSTRAIYAFGKLAEIQPTNHQLLDFYVPVLIRKGYEERAQRVLSLQKLDSTMIEKKLLIAESFYGLGEVDRAHSLLRDEHSKQALFKRIDWFEQSMEWDSATTLVNEVVARDSGVEVLLRKAGLYEKRGWLTSSYNLYELVLAKDSLNSIAREGVQNVGRKIAYLRSLKEERERIPAIEVSPKKGTEDNE